MTRPYFKGSGVTIYHGDCREILPELPKVDLVVTDPPYAIGSTKGEWSASAGVAIGLHEASKRVKRTGTLIAFTATSGRGIEFTQGAIAKALAFNRILTWQKRSGRSRAVSPWRWDTAAVLIFGRAPTVMLGESSVCLSGLRDESEAVSRHPSPLPPDVCAWVVAPFRSDEPRVALDPFMGCGGLLLAARRIGHTVIGIDIDERYCETAAERLSNDSGTLTSTADLLAGCEA